MKRTILYLLTLIIYCKSSSAQQWQWALQIGTQTNDAGQSLASDAFGNIYLAIKSNNDFICKYSAAGIIQWSRSGGNADIKAITTDKVGNVFVIGRIGIYTTFQGGNNNDITVSTAFPDVDAFVAKYDPQGNIQWVQTINEPGASTYALNVKCDVQGNPIICGRSEKNNNSYIFNYFISKYNSSGNLIWNKNSNWMGNVVPRGLATDNDGNCYVAGGFNDTAYFSNIVLTSSGAFDSPVFITKYDYNGNVLWAKKDGTGFNNCFGLDYRKGKIVITGRYMAPSIFGNQVLTGPTNNGSHLFITQYDSAGNFGWARSAMYADGLNVIMDDQNNSFVVGAFRSPNAIFGSGQSTVAISTQKVNNEIFIAKYDSAGVLKWAVAPGGNYGGGNAGTSITRSNNNYIITGNFTETTSFGSYALNAPQNSCGSSDAFLASIHDSINNIVTNIIEIKNDIAYEVWPNPANDYLYLTINASGSPTNIKIFTALGQIVYEAQHNADIPIKEKISISNYKPGLYIIEIISSDQKRSYKLVKN